MEETEPCIICLTDDTPSSIVVFQGSCPCKPKVHPDCLNTWFTTNTTQCPICRKLIISDIEIQYGKRLELFFIILRRVSIFCWCSCVSTIIFLPIILWKQYKEGFS